MSLTFCFRKGVLHAPYLEEGEELEKPAGVFIKAAPGLTAGAELLNGRLAMLGITIVVLMSVSSGVSVLDIINAGVGVNNIRFN